MSRWLELCVKTSADGVDAVVNHLTLRGITGLVIEDESDFLRFLEEHRQYWDYVDESLAASMRGRAQVKFYLPDSADAEQAGSAAVADLPGVAVSAAWLDEEDWGTAYQRYYMPMPVGNRLFIVPAWLDVPPPPGRVSLRLNPGLTFGTGNHATTRLCLEGLERYVKPGDDVLDLGCGSGILSIAALRLGAAHAAAVDLDPKAASAARENAALNGIDAAQYALYTGDVLHDTTLVRSIASRTYPVILANIVADVILALAPRVRPWLQDGGVFLCSGIIDTRGDEVRQGLEQAGWRILNRREQDGWIAFECAAPSF